MHGQNVSTQDDSDEDNSTDDEYDNNTDTETRQEYDNLNLETEIITDFLFDPSPVA